jgi:POT family proton-dependent oligopeptide transporter
MAERYPPQVKFIIGNEACERFSFYGMRSILTLYMLQYLYFAEPDAKAWFHYFVMANYLTPLVGGWIADRYWGRYRTILWISLAYVVGHATLAAWETPAGLLAGCSLIALGAGGIKPCVSAFVGDQFGPGQRTLLNKVYGWFYWSINLGSASSYLLIPWLLKNHGPAVAFAVPGVLMAIALLFFWGGTRHYVMVPPSGPNPHNIVAVVRHALNKLGTGRPGQHWLDLARERHPEEAVEGAKAVFRLMGVFAAVSLFWALFDQKGSTWVIQAKQMDRMVFGWEPSPAAFQVFNPMLIMALIPLFSWVIFPALERRGVPLAPLRKMTAGMFLTAASFGVAAVLQIFIEASLVPGGGPPPNILWQFPQYLLLTVGEILVSVTGLEFSYTQAPRAMRSTIMSVWFLAVAAGNLITAVLSTLVRLQGAANLWLYAALMLVAALVFRAVARRYRPWTPEAAPGPSAG